MRQLDDFRRSARLCSIVLCCDTERTRKAMKLLVVDEDGNSLQLDVDASMALQDFQALIEAEVGSSPRYVSLSLRRSATQRQALLLPAKHCS